MKKLQLKKLGFPGFKSESLRLMLQSLRLMLWRFAGNRIAGVALYLLGHGMHWRERHRWLSEHGPVQAFQRGMASVALVIGAAYAVTGKGQAASPLADLLDRIAPRAWLYPHQWMGLMLMASSTLLLVAIYEWPVKSEWSASDPRTEGMTDARLRRLLGMQLAGHMIALVYWGLTGCLLLFACCTSAGGWGSLAFCVIHHHLYVRNNREYEKEAGVIRRERIHATAYKMQTEAYKMQTEAYKMQTEIFRRDEL